MIRYRDGKIVSTKGERYTQVTKAESEEMRKSYVNNSWQLLMFKMFNLIMRWHLLTKLFFYFHAAFLLFRIQFLVTLISQIFSSISFTEILTDDFCHTITLTNSVD